MPVLTRRPIPKDPFIREKFTRERTAAKKLAAEVSARCARCYLVDAAMPPIISGHLRARKIWIDDALGGATRCRRIALR